MYNIYICIIYVCIIYVCMYVCNVCMYVCMLCILCILCKLCILCILSILYILSILSILYILYILYIIYILYILYILLIRIGCVYPVKVMSGLAFNHPVLRRLIIRDAPSYGKMITKQNWQDHQQDHGSKQQAQ